MEKYNETYVIKDTDNEFSFSIIFSDKRAVALSIYHTRYGKNFCYTIPCLAEIFLVRQPLLSIFM